MTRKSEQSDVEPHVFDQTNGVVDLGRERPSEDVERERDRHRTVGGIAMLSANRPGG